MSQPPRLREDFVNLLRCPATRQRLKLADPALVARFNTAMAAGRVSNIGGDCLAEAAEALLLREDGLIAYPVIGKIPRLTKEEGVEIGNVEFGTRNAE